MLKKKTVLNELYYSLVHLAGIEPVRVASLDPKSSASASSAIGANGAVYRNRTNNLMITNQLLCQLS